MNYTNLVLILLIFYLIYRFKISEKFGCGTYENEKCNSQIPCECNRDCWHKGRENHPKSGHCQPTSTTNTGGRCCCGNWRNKDTYGNCLGGKFAGRCGTSSNGYDLQCIDGNTDGCGPHPDPRCFYECENHCCKTKCW